MTSIPSAQETITSANQVGVTIEPASANYLSDRDYSFIYSRAPRSCVDLAITSSRGVLLGWRSKGAYQNTWGLPGGAVRMRESLSDALSRITSKELGLTLTSRKLLGYMEFLDEQENNEPRHSISLTFQIEVPADLISEKVLQQKKLQWFSKRSADAHPVHADFLCNYGLLDPQPEN